MSYRRLLAANRRLNSKLAGKDARILGHFKGEIELTGHLFTGEGSRVEATASVETAELAGQYDGEIKARSLVLLEKASVTGKLLTQSLAVREGAQINGGVDAGADPKARAATQPPKVPAADAKK